MQFGVCGDPNVAVAAAKASYDFAEWAVGELLKPREPYEAFQKTLEELLDQGVHYPVLNCFIPGDLKITGPDADIPALQIYVKTVFERAEKAGVEIIVFGSGKARRIPDGFDKEAAHTQIVSFCSMVAPIAYEHGITVVVEPLNKAECNVLLKVAECAELVREVSHPAFRLLVDAYHLMLDHDSYEDIVANADLISHGHIATVPNRLAPDAESCDFTAFFESLLKGGYDGRISIEARIEDPAKELPGALSLMQRLADTNLERDINNSA